MIFRRAKVDDIPRIHQLLTQVNNIHAHGRPDLFKSGNRKYTDEQLATIIADAVQRPVFVAADDDDRLLGYCFCIVEQFVNDNNRTDVKTLYIDDLCVDEQCRGMNVGKQLYEHVVAFARGNGFYNITLNVWECNPGARRFYDKMGLVPLKTYLEKIL